MASEPTEEQSSKFFIFGKGRDGNEGGGREIFPLGFTKGKTATNTEELGTFMMVDGQDSSPAKYIKDKQTWIPKDVSDLNSKVEKEATYNEVLIMFAELYYGAKWNPDTAQLEITPESKKWHMDNPLKFAQYLGRFKNMNHMHHLITGGTKSRIKFDDNTAQAKKHGIAGFGKDMYQRYKRVVVAYQNPVNVWTETNKTGVKPLIGKRLTKSERERMQKTVFKARPAELEQKWRQSFYDEPYIQDWVAKMKENNVEGADSIRSAIARVFLINNFLHPSSFKSLTIDAQNQSDEVKIKKLKKLVAVWKKWNSKYDTDEDFYLQKWTDPLYDPKEKLEFPDGLWGALKEFPQRDHKGGLPREYDPFTSEETARKSGADVLVAFITNAEGGWSIADQPAKTMLSRKTQTPLFAEHGAEIDDKQVREAMKFLETGKIHHWSQKMNDGKPVYRQVIKFNAKTQKEETEFEKINELKPDETDNELHYNDQLKEYSKYGNPYTPLSPASLLFRLSILCGWRKTEALTATTRERSKATLKSLANFDRDEKPSGVSIDKEKGTLKISFLTRKTKKRGAEGAFFTVVIPPFSSSVMDTRETIELVCKKCVIGKWAKTDYYQYKDVDGHWVEEENKNWIPKIIDLEQKDKDEIFPALSVKSHGQIITRAKGVKSEWLIGDNGQFYRETGITKNGNRIPTYDMPDGSGKYGVANLSEKEMIRAYIDFPLMECYAVMTGSTVGKHDDQFVMDQAKKDHAVFVEQNKKHKTFLMLNGWSQVCDLGCPKSDLGKKQTGKYSKERMDQDATKYMTSDQDYWLERSIHSLRHIFAQLWLRKSKWNFGVVADRGHWETLDTLKKHYGGVPDETLGDFMTEVLASDQVGEKKMDQAVNRSIALRSEEGGYSEEMAGTIKEQDVIEEPTEEELKEEKEEVADV